VLAAAPAFDLSGLRGDLPGALSLLGRQPNPLGLRGSRDRRQHSEHERERSDLVPRPCRSDELTCPARVMVTIEQRPGLAHEAAGIVGQRRLQESWLHLDQCDPRALPVSTRKAGQTRGDLVRPDLEQVIGSRRLRVAQGGQSGEHPLAPHGRRPLARRPVTAQSGLDPRRDTRGEVHSPELDPPTRIEDELQRDQGRTRRSPGGQGGTSRRALVEPVQPCEQRRIGATGHQVAGLVPVSPDRGRELHRG
jgi:hypothetical protein